MDVTFPLSPDDDFGDLPAPGHEYDDLIASLPGQLRSRICHDEMYCPVPERDFDHGHTNCLFMGLAAAEIERLRIENDVLGRLVSGLVQKACRLPAYPPPSWPLENHT